MNSAFARPCALLGLLSTALLAGCSVFDRDLDDFDEAGQWRQGPRRWSEEWYSQTAHAPPGARQRQRHGKLWPPFPRPAGESPEWTHQFHAAHYWPYPYICQDRQYIRDFSERQVNRGWIKETTLYDYHFDDETDDLNHSGRLHLRWILHGTPLARRFVWVQTAGGKSVSQDRLDHVRKEAIALVGEDNLPPVMLRVAEPYGWPADRVNEIWTRDRATLPDPRIEYNSLPTGVDG